MMFATSQQFWGRPSVGFWGGTKLTQWTPKMVVDTYQETLKPKYTIGPYNLAHEQF